MQPTYREALLKYQKEQDTKNDQFSIASLVGVLLFIYWNEAESIPLTCLLALGSIFFILYMHDKMAKEVELPLSIYDHEHHLRLAAEANNVALMKELIIPLGKLKIGIQDPESGRSPLHFAVGAGSKEALEYIADRDRELAALNLPAHVKVNVFTIQDKQGNTAVHEAILKIISEGENRYPILFALLSKQPDLFMGMGMALVNKTAPINTRINTNLVNNKGESVMALFQQIPNKKSPQYIKATSLLKQIEQSMLLRKQDAAKVTSPTI